MNKFSFQLLRVVNKSLFAFHSLVAKVYGGQGSILMMHHVGGIVESPYNLSISTFNNLLKSLSSKNVVSLDSIGKSKYFYVLTFDDVPSDFYENAFPLLRQYNLPFTIFVSSKLLDTPGYISSNQLKEIASSPLSTIGSHGTEHVRYAGYSREELNKVFLYSKNILEGIVGKDVCFFAFPYGSYTTCGLKYKKDLKRYYKLGFSTIPVQLNKIIWHYDYFLPRINVEEGNYFKLIRH